jgi:hypothetical protein
MGRAGVVVALVACACALEAGSASPLADPSPKLLVGIDDDSAKWKARPDKLLATYRDLGLGAVRVTIPWHRGQNRPDRVSGIYLHRTAMMVARGQRVILAVYGSPADAPLDHAARAAYCGFLHHVLSRIPIRDVVVWNEANSPQFWPTAGGAAAYEALLADCWDRLRRLSPAVNLISSTAAHYDPAAFMREVAAAYRESGRLRPIVSTFGHNPYPDNAAEPPWVRHDDLATVGEADLPRLLAAIEDGFTGTRQPLPGSGQAFVWYLENGFQTIVAPSKRRFYTGVETDLWAVPPVAPEGVDAWYRDQASQIRDALLLASCQPEVGAYFNFELIDEDRLAGWQSGVLWRDGTRKASYAAFKEAVATVRAGRVDCASVPGAGGAPPERPASHDSGAPD